MANEPLVSYRAWNIYGRNVPGEESLWPIFASEEWIPGIPMVRNHADHGIYSWKKMYDTINYVSIELCSDVFCTCIGEIHSWGQIQEFSKGYQSEFAYPKKLYIINNPELAQNLQRRYGCEVKNIKINRKLFTWPMNAFNALDDFVISEANTILFSLKCIFLSPLVLFLILPKILFEHIIKYQILMKTK